MVNTGMPIAPIIDRIDKSITVAKQLTPVGRDWAPDWQRLLQEKDNDRSLLGSIQSSGAQTVEEYVAYLKAQPDSPNLASWKQRFAYHVSGAYNILLKLS